MERSSAFLDSVSKSLLKKLKLARSKITILEKQLKYWTEHPVYNIILIRFYLYSIITNSIFCKILFSLLLPLNFCCN